MNVVYLFQDDYPWDVRVEKFARSIAKAGHGVHVVCRNRKASPTFERCGDGVSIHRLPRVAWPCLRSVVGFPAFFSPFWIGRLLSVAARTRADLIMVRDLPLSPAAWFVARLLRRPVLLDLAEDYPAMLRDTWRLRGPTSCDRVIRNPALLARMERAIVRRADGVIVVAPASARRVAGLGAHPESTWVVHNTPMLEPETAGPAPLAPDVDRRDSELVLIYVGGLEAVRGLETAIRALALLRKHVPTARLWIAGTGDSEPSLKALADELGVTSSVDFLGWVDSRLVPALIARADVGLAPHRVTDHTNTTMPNKVYDYMLQGKPVVVSNTKTLEEFVTMIGCGAVFRDADHQDLCEKVLGLGTAEQRRAIGRMGLLAIQERFNWSVDERTLLQAIHDTAGRYRPPDRSPSSSGVLPSGRVPNRP